MPVCEICQCLHRLPDKIGICLMLDFHSKLRRAALTGCAPGKFVPHRKRSRKVRKSSGREQWGGMGGPQGLGLFLVFLQALAKKVSECVLFGSFTGCCCTGGFRQPLYLLNLNPRTTGTSQCIRTVLAPHEVLPVVPQGVSQHYGI